MTTPTREQIVDALDRGLQIEYDYHYPQIVGMISTAAAILALFAEQTARVVELEAENKRLAGLRWKIRGALEADVEPVVKIKLVREALGEKP